MVSISTSSLDHYQIAIIGGGIAGVTLALACEAYGIRYALFEARDSLAPADGASIGLQANGIRILDQLGVWEELEKHTVPVKRWRHFDENGELLCKSEAFSYYPSKSVCLRNSLHFTSVLNLVGLGMGALVSTGNSC
jgi:FAD dependent monooxygenase